MTESNSSPHSTHPIPQFSTDQRGTKLIIFPTKAQELFPQLNTRIHGLWRTRGPVQISVIEKKSPDIQSRNWVRGCQDPHRHYRSRGSNHSRENPTPRMENSPNNAGPANPTRKVAPDSSLSACRRRRRHHLRRATPMTSIARRS